MVKVTYRNNVAPKTMIVDENTTLRNCLEANDIDYSRGIMYLDGSPLQPGDMDKTFRALGIEEKCFLSSIVKADNA